MKNRIYKFFLVLICTALINNVLAQDKTGSPANLDSLIQQAQKSLEKSSKAIDSARKELSLKSKELRELQLKKMELGRPNFEKQIAELQNQLGSFNSTFRYLDFSGKFNFNNQLNSFNDLLNQQGDNKLIEKTKTITKSYPVDKDDKLSINNKYGKIIINTWDKNEIKVDIEIKASASSDDKAEEALNKVSIKDSKQGNLISFETVNELTSSNRVITGSVNRSSSSASSSSNGRPVIIIRNGINDGIQVNYTVYMPTRNALEINNSYGSITLPDFEGALTLNAMYGDLKGQNLANPANNIKLTYGAVSIENLKSGNIDVTHGSLTLGTAGTLDVRTSYSPVNIERLSGDSNFSLKFGGGLKINKIDPLIKKLGIEASYSPVSLGFDAQSNFNFTVNGNRSDFNYNKDKVSITSSNEMSPGSLRLNNYQGRYGKGSDSQVTISSTYGSVKFL